MIRLRKAGLVESGSGSGDQEMQLEDVLDIALKKRKTRRGKPKHRKLKPYSKQASSSNQSRQHGRRSKNATTRHPPAPYNTNQFLIEDHNDLPDLERRLACEIPFQKPQAPPRTRDSSFSVDSDEDRFYSSPEDEEEFLTKEFSNAYEDVHAERLGSLTKTELIQEYIQLEAKVDLLTKRLKARSLHQDASVELTEADKLKMFQQRIDDLLQQNDKLKRENEKLRAMKDSDSEIDSCSDSDSSWESLQIEQDYSRSNSSTSSSPVPMAYQRRARSKEPESNGTVAISRPRRCSLNDIE